MADYQNPAPRPLGGTSNPRLVRTLDDARQVLVEHEDARQDLQADVAALKKRLDFPAAPSSWETLTVLVEPIRGLGGRVSELRAVELRIPRGLGVQIGTDAPAGKLAAAPAASGAAPTVSVFNMYFDASGDVA
jgi:hypothetical protein